MDSSQAIYDNAFDEVEIKGNNGQETKSKKLKQQRKSEKDNSDLKRGSRRVELHENQAAEYVRSVIKKMHKAADEDELAVSQKRPSLSKFKILDNVLADIIKPKWAHWFLNEGVCAVLGRWLAPNANATLPSLAFRSQILQTLRKLPIHYEHMQGTDLGFRLISLWKSPDETSDNKEAIRSIVQTALKPLLDQRDEESYGYGEDVEEIQQTPKTPFLHPTNISRDKLKRPKESRALRNSLTTSAYTFKVMPKSDVYALQNSDAKQSNVFMQRFNHIISNKRGKFRS